MEAYAMETGTQRECESGQFRIVFTGYRAATAAEEETCSPAEFPEFHKNPGHDWDTSPEDGERAYFHADISWIRLGDDDSPQTASLTAMITGDVRGLRKRPGAAESRSGDTGRLPLSLGTYDLASHKNAVAIGNPACVAAVPLQRAPRSKVIFLTYETAMALAGMDQGYGRGIFPVVYRDAEDAGREITLYFGIDRVESCA